MTRKSPSPNAASNSAPATPTGRNSGTPTSFADAAANGEEEAEAPSPHEKRTRAFLQQHHHQRRRQQQQEQAAASSDGRGSDGGLGGGFDGRGHQGIRIAELVVAREASRVADAATKQAAAAGLAASLLHEGDASRRIDLRPVMELSPHAVLHSMPLPRLHEMFVTQGLRHLYVTDTRNQVVGCITRKDLLPEVLEANNEVYDETAGKSGEGGEHHTPGSSHQARGSARRSSLSSRLRPKVAAHEHRHARRASILRRTLNSMPASIQHAVARMPHGGEDVYARGAESRRQRYLSGDGGSGADGPSSGMRIGASYIYQSKKGGRRHSEGSNYAFSGVALSTAPVDEGSAHSTSEASQGRWSPVDGPPGVSPAPSPPPRASPPPSSTPSPPPTHRRRYTCEV